MGRFLRTASIDSFDALYRAALHAVESGEQTVELNPVELCVLLSRFSRATDTALRPATAGGTPGARRPGSPWPWTPLEDLLAQHGR